MQLLYHETIIIVCQSVNERKYAKESMDLLICCV